MKEADVRRRRGAENIYIYIYMKGMMTESIVDERQNSSVGFSLGRKCKIKYDALVRGG